MAFFKAVQAIPKTVDIGSDERVVRWIQYYRGSVQIQSTGMLCDCCDWQIKPGQADHFGKGLQTFTKSIFYFGWFVFDKSAVSVLGNEANVRLFRLKKKGLPFRWASHCGHAPLAGNVLQFTGFAIAPRWFEERWRPYKSFHTNILGGYNPNILPGRPYNNIVGKMLWQLPFF
jgi:hypothetical protein